LYNQAQYSGKDTIVVDNGFKFQPNRLGLKKHVNNALSVG